MIWSDKLIKETGVVKPMINELVQPNSYDIRLDKTILVQNIFGKWKKKTLPYKLKRGKFILGSSIERVSLPNGVCAMVDGKSTLARKGVTVHQTAGWIDTGFNGNITLELGCLTKKIKLEEGMRIGQIVFMDSYECDNVYNGHYQNQEGVTKAWS